MTNKQKLEANEMKQELIEIRGCRCEVCGDPVNYFTCQLAHRIPKTKANLKKYGSAIINHRFNLVLTDCLKCNSSVLLNEATHPIEVAELIERIKEDLCQTKK